MNLTLPTICRVAAIGLAATLLMDLWNLFLRRVFGITSLNYCLLGRWISHMTGGRFAHEHITRAEVRPFECPVGYLAHYSIGMAFALVLTLMAPGWLERPTLAPALLFGIGTVALPYFVMQPALGLGVASSRTPSPARARVKSLATHTVFGLGLYLAALALQTIRP